MAHKTSREIPTGSRKTYEMVRCAWCQCETLVKVADLPTNLFGNKVWEHECPLRPKGAPKDPDKRWRQILAWEAEGRHDKVEEMLNR